MDRDNRWERVSKAYYLLTGKEADHKAASATEAVQHYYDNPLDNSRKGDEFVVPTWVTDDVRRSCWPLLLMGTRLIFYNYRGRPSAGNHSRIY